ncbi:MAG: cytochrome c family protein [Pseudomonadota bacterium]|nr:cytochrome c family protein [Pseudomonadota bacterium]
MSGFESNKVFAAVLLAGLVAMMSGFIAHVLSEPEMPEKNAYVVEVPQAGQGPGTASTAPAGPEDIRPLLASADLAAGQKITRACAACHSFDKGGPDKVGPNLWGVVGGPKAHRSGFSYSAAMQGAGGEWSYDELNHFLFSPKGYISGTKMVYGGVKDTKDRANLIAWLRSQADSPRPLP